MAGQLTIDTLKASTGVLATQNGMTGIGKAWVSFTGAAGAIRSSFNVGSITKNGTGDWTVNFTTNMVDINYAAIACCSTTVGGGTAEIVCDINTQTGGNTYAPTASACRFITSKSGSGTLDPAYVNFIALGN